MLTRLDLGGAASSLPGPNDDLRPDFATEPVPQEQKRWKSLFAQLPQPILMLDGDRQIVVVTRRAAELLALDRGALEGQNADRCLNLISNSFEWDASRDKSIDTRIDQARVIFEISTADDPFGVAGTMYTYLTIVHCSRLGSTLYDTRKQYHDSEFLDAEAEWFSLRSQMLDEIPAVILAVSKDGQHVYQNVHAHESLGPVVAPKNNSIENWVKQQYAKATWPNGGAIDYRELPIYQAAFLGRKCDRFEVLFENYYFMISSRPLYDAHGNHCGGVVFSHDVTQIRREAEVKEQLALQQSDIKFREVANTMEQLVWVIVNDEVIFLNDRWYEYTGGTQESSLGSAWYNYIHPDDMENTKNNWVLGQVESGRFAMHHRLRGADGIYRWYLARAIAVRNDDGSIKHWMGTSTDITQISDALQEAKEAKEQLFKIMQVANVHYFVVRTDFIMSSIFLAGGADGPGLYGRHKTESLLDRDIRTLLSSKVLTDLCDVFSGKSSSAADESEIEGVWWKTKFEVMRDASTGDILGVVGTATDITEDKLKDEQLAKASTERMVALRNSRFKGEFLARMSHEIRTPIGGVLGMVQLMKDTFHPDDGLQIFCSHEKESESLEYLDSIKRCGDALLVIINDILDFSKIEIGKMDIESQPFDLRLMATDVYNSAKYGAPKNTDVDFRLDYTLPDNVVFKGDNNRIRQVLMNLVSNALKFTQTGSVVCQVSLCDEEEQNAPLNTIPGQLSWVKFEVRDTGIGIPKSALDKLFNPFVQADSSTARRFGGSGLGLSIACQLVKLMSGVLRLDSVPSPELGHGSVATCIIPLELVSTDGMQNIAAQPLIKFPGSPRALLVEDNPIIQLVTTKTLQKLGLDVTVTENGQEALDFLATAQAGSMPQVVLMDCQMPILDGYEATGRIRKQVDSRIRTLPIIAMTASAISGDREKCLEAGMNDYISKPIDPLLLSQTISKYLNPVPGVQTSANLITDQGTNVRPAKDAVTGKAPSTVSAGTDPHSSARESRQPQQSETMDTTQ